MHGRATVGLDVFVDRVHGVPIALVLHARIYM